MSRRTEDRSEPSGSDEEEPRSELDSSDSLDEGLPDEGEDATGRDRTLDGVPTVAEDPRRRRLGPLLLGIGGGSWILVALIRCAPASGPDLTVSPADPDEEVARAQPDAKPAQGDAVPTPASDRPPAPDERAADPDEEPEEAPAPDGDFAPRPGPAPWALDLQPPTEVEYTIRHGGSLENVANLFKIYHHEITSLNPGIDLQKELPPQTSVVVYRREEGEVSESVGLPSAGSLEGAVPMLEGPGRVLKMIPWKSWATGRTVTLLDAVLRQWAQRPAPVQPVLVGNMSSRTGGRLKPHSTHQSGRDVDLGYPQRLPRGEELNWREMTEQNLDPGQTWQLLRLLAQTGAIEVIYVDRSIQKLLFDYAVAHKLMSKRTLGQWMEYPRPTGSGSPVIQHVPGHIDHLHARFVCQPHEDRCSDR